MKPLLAAWCGGILWLVIASLALIGCASQPPSQGVSPPAVRAPEWRVGDRWQHAWIAGTEKGIKTSEVADIREMAGSRYYVLRVGATSWFFTPDLHWAGLAAEARIVARSSPPRPWFVWPLDVGRMWHYDGAYEDQERKTKVKEAYAVRNVETVQVPAGTFRAIRVERDGGTDGSDEYWYAPDVRWYVKWRGRRGIDQFEEVLTEFEPATSSALQQRRPVKP